MTKKPQQKGDFNCEGIATVTSRREIAVHNASTISCCTSQC